MAVALTVMSGWAVNAGQVPRRSFPGPARSFAFDVNQGRGPFGIGVRSTRSQPSQVTLFVGDKQASFLHPGRRTAFYLITLPPSGISFEQVRIEVNPPASVLRVSATAGIQPRHPPLLWQQTGPPTELVSPRPARPDRPIAEASVDESDTYGLRLFGVPVREAPRVAAPLVTTVSHGDRLRSTCWTVGDVVTDGFPERPNGAYTSDVWFRVATAPAPGYISDVRFSRRGTQDRLNLPRCGDP